jgi:hypothetical protein
MHVIGCFVDQYDVRICSKLVLDMPSLDLCGLAHELNMHVIGCFVDQ